LTAEKTFYSLLACDWLENQFEHRGWPAGNDEDGYYVYAIAT
jgi:hypothetical protein